MHGTSNALSAPTLNWPLLTHPRYDGRNPQTSTFIQQALPTDLINLMAKSRDFIGPYRLARLIRLGSTAEVWEAIEESKQERFALKVLKESISKNRNEIALLKHEFNVAKDLSSPRVVKIFEYREDGGRPYLVLELFSELNMKQALRRGPDSLAFMLDKIVSQAAEGLYYMHTTLVVNLFRYFNINTATKLSDI